MKHPNVEQQIAQEDFLKNCPEADRNYHARLFRIGNAAYCYHQLAVSTSYDRLKFYYNEWLQGLSGDFKVFAEKQGLEKCRTMLPFTRYVNERKDNPMGQFMKEHLSEDDYNYYKESSISL